jgi:hypothetical protein
VQVTASRVRGPSCCRCTLGGQLQRRREWVPGLGIEFGAWAQDPPPGLRSPSRHVPGLKCCSWVVLSPNVQHADRLLFDTVGVPLSCSFTKAAQGTSLTFANLANQNPSSSSEGGGQYSAGPRARKAGQQSPTGTSPGSFSMSSAMAEGSVMEEYRCRGRGGAGASRCPPQYPSVPICPLLDLPPSGYT